MRQPNLPGGAVAAEPSEAPDPPQATPRPLPEGRPGFDLKTVLELVGSVAAPVTVITGLLFYFGWIYTGAFYRYFAIHQALLDLSVRDYVLRSVNPMLWPVIFLLALAGAWSWAHGLLVRSLNDEPARLRARRLGVVLGGVGGACCLTGLLAATIGDPDSSLTRALIAPLSLAAGVALIGYGSHLHRRTQGRRPPTPGGGSEPRLARSVGLGVVAMLVTINLLWAVAHFADALGRGDAERLAIDRFKKEPAVVLYSPHRLFLDPYGGVQEAPMGDKDDAYRFRYANLRLLTRAGGRYFLVPSGWGDTDPVVIVLDDDDPVRVEFITTTPARPRS